MSCMNILKWRLAIFSASLVGLLASSAAGLLDPLKHLLLAQADVRVLVTEDQARRVQTIGVRNAGSVSTDPVIAEVSVDRSSIVDFRCSKILGGPADSFLSSLSRADVETVAQAAGMNKEKLTALFDEHATFHALSQFQQMLAISAGRRIDKASGKLQEVEKHTALLDRCRGAAPGDRECQAEMLQEDLEHALMVLEEKLAKGFRESTGVEPYLPLYPRQPQRLSLQIPTPANESRLIEIVFSETPQARLELTRQKDKSTVVNRVEDLTRSAVWIMLSYHTVETLIAVGSVVFCALLGAVLFIPVHTQPAYKILARAVRSHAPESDPIWDLAQEKVRHLLLDEFQHDCALKGKQVAISQTQLFEHFRNELLIEHGVHGTVPENRADLERMARTCVRGIVDRA